MGEGEGVLGLVATRVRVVLYAIEDDGASWIEKVRLDASSNGYEIVHERVGALNDPEAFTDVIAEARIAKATVFLVPTIFSVGAKTPEDFVKKIESIRTLGIHLVVLWSPRVDTRTGILPDDLIQTLRGILSIKSSGGTLAMKEWAAKRKEDGLRMGPMPKCLRCGHGVVSKIGAKRGGHFRRKIAAEGEEVGPCSICGCNSYRPRNKAMMGGK